MCVCVASHVLCVAGNEHAVHPYICTASLISYFCAPKPKAGGKGQDLCWRRTKRPVVYIFAEEINQRKSAPADSEVFNLAPPPRLFRILCFRGVLMRFCKGDVNVCGVSVRDRPPSCSAPQHGEAVACVVKHIYTDTKTFFVFSVLVGLDATAVHIFREGITHEKIGRTWKKIGRRNPREKRALILPCPAAGSIPSPQAGVIYV